MPDTAHTPRRALPLFLLAGFRLSSLDTTAKYLVRDHSLLLFSFVISALMLAPASPLTPFSYLQKVWVTGSGYLVFGQLPDGFSAVGMAVIVASGLLLAWTERRHPRAV